MLPACTHDHAVPTPGLRADSATLTVNADWEDADAAVFASTDKVDAVCTRVVAVSDTVREYQLRRTTGERGRLEIRRASGATSEQNPPTPPDPTDLTMTCSIGRLGDPERERRLMEAVAKRLTQLRGVDFAPIK